MPKLSKFRKALRSAEKASKHVFKNIPLSAKKNIKDRDDAYCFRVETTIELQKCKRQHRSIPMNKLK